MRPMEAMYCLLEPQNFLKGHFSQISFNGAKLFLCLELGGARTLFNLISGTI